MVIPNFKHSLCQG